MISCFERRDVNCLRCQPMNGRVAECGGDVTRDGPIGDQGVIDLALA